MTGYASQKGKALTEWWASRQCEHPEKEIRKRTIRNGSIQYVSQCVRCGRAVGNALSKAKAIEQNGGYEPTVFDDSLEDAWKKETNEGAAKIAGDYEQRGQIMQDEFFEWYNQYLLSSDWLDRRKKVLERAGGLCEGCRQAPANQVHHLTYKHVGRELLYELVALCSACHEIAHDEKDEYLQDNVTAPNSDDLEDFDVEYVD